MTKHSLDYERPARTGEPDPRGRSLAGSRLIALPIFAIACLVFAAQFRGNSDAAWGSTVLAVLAAVLFAVEHVISFFR